MKLTKRDILKKYTGKGGTNAISPFQRAGGDTRNTINQPQFGPTSGIKDSIAGISSGIKGGIKAGGNELTQKAFKQTFFNQNPAPLGNQKLPPKLPEPRDSNFLKTLKPKK